MRTIEEIRQDIKKSDDSVGIVRGFEYLNLFMELAQAQDAEIARLRQQLEWQPIETAPKDKRIIIAHLPLDGIADIWFGYWSHQHSSWATTQWHTYPADWITHWMPIPPLPQEEKEENHE